MPPTRWPKPLSQEDRPLWVEDGTMCRVPSPLPGPFSTPDPAQFAPRPTIDGDSPVRATVSVTGEISAQLTWDSFVRIYFYDPAAEAISKQGKAFVTSGRMTAEEAAQWVNAQRNSLVVAVRDQRNSPLGRAYAEWLKPRSSLPTTEELVAKKLAKGLDRAGALEAVIESAGSTRASVNKLAVVFRWAGPAAIAVDLSFSAYVVWKAPASDRGRVAARQAGGTAGALSFGFLGGLAVGAICSTGFGCLILVGVGAAGSGYVGHEMGKDAGEFYYDSARSLLHWVEEAR